MSILTWYWARLDNKPLRLPMVFALLVGLLVVFNNPGGYVGSRWRLSLRGSLGAPVAFSIRQGRNDGPPAWSDLASRFRRSRHQRPPTYRRPFTFARTAPTTVLEQRNGHYFMSVLSQNVIFVVLTTSFLEDPRANERVRSLPCVVGRVDKSSTRVRHCA